eukprot:TRINITY_DN1468_c0_g1_i7.p2 TRINITY_DN1468_c0_g1~~TRINITY_DN1468_c0_g1_i7.p2  ORF type:complete len:129 (+),score=21.08 TRINITY_DN1468_c0_g1_i7:84-470(+)
MCIRDRSTWGLQSFINISMRSNKLFRMMNLVKYRNQPGFHFTRVDIPTQANEAEIKRTGFKKGDSAPHAYSEKIVFPEDYKPYNLNYKGNGLLACMVVGLFYALYEYEKNYLIKTNQSRRPQGPVYKP